MSLLSVLPDMLALHGVAATVSWPAAGGYVSWARTVASGTPPDAVNTTALLREMDGERIDGVSILVGDIEIEVPASDFPDAPVAGCQVTIGSRVYGIVSPPTERWIYGALVSYRLQGRRVEA